MVWDSSATVSDTWKVSPSDDFKVMVFVDGDEDMVLIGFWYDFDCEKSKIDL